MRLTRQLRLTGLLPVIIILASIIGLIASSVLTYDQVQIWQNPHYYAPCNLNPVISCGSVISSKQGHVFGVPSPFIGLIMFSALGAIGITLLAGAKLKRWFWLGLQSAITGGVVFAIWLFWLSLYRVHALCPYCLATDAAVYTLALYITLYNIEQGHILTSKRLMKLNRFATKHHLDILIGIFVFLAAFILNHFWYYYGRNF